MRILAIDPGTTESGWCVIDADDCAPLEFGKTHNDELLKMLPDMVFDEAVIEMVASYGMAVGADVFETCIWVGRFLQVGRYLGAAVELSFRRIVKLHLCHSGRAKDGEIVQALIDRFARGQANHGKGTRARPGFFYGFRADIWQAYALAVTYADQLMGRD